MDKSDPELEAEIQDRKEQSRNREEKRWQNFITEGSEASFQEVFEYYYQPLYGYGLKLCNHSEVVKDSIHDLFKNIWERRDSLTHIRSPRVYLFVSLRRKVRKTMKKQRSNTSDLTEIREEETIYFGREEIIIRDEVKFQQKKKLRQALNQLSDRQKEVIYLHYYNGLSYREIEEILSIKRQSVRNHIYRAMEALRSQLDIEIMKLVSSLSMVCWFLSHPFL